MLVWSYINVCGKGNIMLVWCFKMDAFADMWKNMKLYMYFGASECMRNCDLWSMLRGFIPEWRKKERRFWYLIVNVQIGVLW